MSEFQKRLTVSVGVYSGIIAVLGIILFFVGSDITRRTDEIKQIRSELLFRVQLTESLALLREGSEEAKNYAAALNGILPTQDQLITFPREIGAVARQSNIDFNFSLGQEKSVAEEKLKRTGFTMTGQGLFENLTGFLKSLELAGYPLSFDSIDLTRQDSNFKALITGNLFSF